MSTTGAEGSEDVNDFLQRIKELGDRRDQEDEERNRKLEEEILQGRAERQARRAERARSISPTKSSPAVTPTSRTPVVKPVALSDVPSPIIKPRGSDVDADTAVEDAMNRLTGSSPTKEGSSPFEAPGPETARPLSIKAASPSGAMPSRNSPLSWQRRPESQASDRPRSRTLSMVATENAARSPKPSPLPSESTDEPTPSRDQIAQSLASKDPTWFKQTADRGLNSPAYRRNQVEDEDRSDHSSGASRGIQMPGMFAKPEKEELVDRSSSPSRMSTSSTARSSYSAATTGSGGLGSPITLTTAQRFEPPAMAMSPSQGRISPDRLDRPPSPTKGMGGFVQSAMMKRSDSVSKRWSVQSPAGLSRGNSVASNRNSADPSGLGASALARDQSPKTLSRPSSSHSNATITQEGRPGTSNSFKSSTDSATPNDNNGFVRPTLPLSKSQTSLTGKSTENTAPDEPPARPQTPVPTSPSKTMDSRRWSPTKSSWLESALNKPESPKPKATASQQQPSWMAEIAKARQKGSVDLGRNPTVKHEVKVGGLLRSPATGAVPKPLGVGGLPTGVTPGTTHKASTSISSGLQPGSLNTMPLAKTSRVGSIDSSSPVEGKPKPDTPPKKDFRSVLKSRQIPTDTAGKDEPEFKNVFGQLKRTKTQNYVAPDELKSNITRGKMALNVTGGPKKNERKDDFREAILKKKDDFVKAQSEGKGVTRTASGSEIPAPLPEALARRQTLSRSDSVSSIGSFKIDGPPKQPATLQKETSSPGRLQTKEPTIGGKLAGRLNPALAGLLARGPPTAVESNRSTSPPTSQRSLDSSTSSTNQEIPDAGPQLTHMTKGRARGPKRKVPSAATSVNQLSGATPASPVNPTTTPAAEPTAKVTDASVPKAIQVKKSDDSPEPDTTPKTPLRVDTDRPKPSSKIASLAEALSTPKSPLKEEIERPASPSKVASIAEALKISRPRSSTKTDLEKPVSQPSSPRKLDMKRRSQFLREAPSSDTKIESQLGTPKSISTKKANAVETSINPQEPEKSIEAKNKPQIESDPEKSTPPKTKPEKKPSLSLKSTTKQDLPVEVTPKSRPVAPVKTPLLSPDSTKPSFVPSPSIVTPETARKLTPAPLSPIKMKSMDQAVKASPTTSARSVSDDRNILPQTPKGDGETVSVKNATALWGRSPTAATPSGPPRARSPIKLPTKDETPETQGVPARSRSPIREKIEIAPALRSITKSSRPLPTPPTKGPRSPSSSTGSVPLGSPPTAGSKPQPSEASQLLENFFVDRKPPPPYKVDTAKVLTSRPEPAQLVQTLQSALYQLSADGKKQLVPSHQERILFEGNMYLCIHNFENAAGKKVVEAYFWAGDDVPAATVDGTQTFAQREARAAGGKLIKLQQGKETPEFFQALGGILIIRRGSSNKYDSLAPHILCGRSFFGQIAFDEVDFASTSLCSGFPYLILAPSGKAYLWKGKGSGIDELSCARLLGMDFGLTGVVDEVEDGHEPTDFLQIFGSETAVPLSADHWRLKSSYTKYCGRLFCAEPNAKMSGRSSLGSTLFGSGPEQIVEISPFNQADISSSNIYILDAFFEIYIIVGSRSQQQYPAFHNALLFASEYGILAASMEDRPFVPITNCVLEGVPKDLKSVFRKWTGGLQPTVQSVSKPLARGRSLRVVPLTAALEAVRN